MQVFPALPILECASPTGYLDVALPWSENRGLRRSVPRIRGKRGKFGKCEYAENAESAENADDWP